MLLVVSSLLVSLLGSRSAVASAQASRQHAAVLRAAAVLLIEVEAAESGQRGYLLTGQGSYLQTYSLVQADIPRELASLGGSVSRNGRPRVAELQTLVGKKQLELAQTIDLRRTRGIGAALAVVNNGQGQLLMGQIFSNLESLEQAAQTRLDAQDRKTSQARTRAEVGIGLGIGASAVLLVLLLWLAVQRRRLDTARRDAENAREQLVDELSQQATHDALTGLPNRRLATDRLEQALIRGTPEQLVAVLFIDLDRFKHINDQYGHKRGDDVLVQATQQMRMALRPADTLARVGGDEFVAICEGLGSESEGGAVAERLRSAVGESADRPAATAVGASVGLAFSPATSNRTGTAGTGRNGDSAAQPSAITARSEALLDAADAAMYEAKQQGRGRVAVYSRDLAVAREQHRLGLGSLSQGFESGQLWVAYQPVVKMQTEGIIGVEALLRWSDPDRGIIPPDQFIPTAEESGLILRIGEFVLRTACSQVAEWNATSGEDIPPLSVAVNVSGRQLSEPGFLDLVLETLAFSRLPAGLLCLEVTETVLIDAVGGGFTELGRLSELGVRIALDDFGTGYSSLAYLRRFPIDIVKIDRSFVAGLGVNEEDDAIVSAIVGLARSLRRSVVAEGIETAGQANHLRALDCANGQGYLYAKPLSALNFEALLLRDRQRHRAGSPRRSA
jgi:diguanylate cyclase (GGDEF)-like protein